MNVHEIRRYQMLTRVRDFGARYKPLFAPFALAQQMFAEVDAAISAADERANDETSGRRRAQEHTAAKGAARATLLHRLAAVRRTARVLVLDGRSVAGRFTLPRSPRAAELVATARAFISHAAPLEAAFVEHAMPPAFLSDLAAAIDDVESAMHNRFMATGAHIAARVGIETSVAAGFAAVRRLDVLVANHLDDHPELLAAWKTARRVARSPQRTKDEGQRTDQAPRHLDTRRLVPAIAVPEREAIARAQHDGPVTQQRGEEPHHIPDGMRPHLAA